MRSDILCPRRFCKRGRLPRRYDAVWGGIYELADDEETGVPRPGQVLRITRIDQLLANDPFITLQIGHFVKTAAALATPFDPQLDAGAGLRLLPARVVEIPVHQDGGAVLIQPPHRAVNTRTGDDPRAAADRDRASRGRAHRVRQMPGDRFPCAVRASRRDFQVLHRQPVRSHPAVLSEGPVFRARELAFVEDWVAPGAHIVEVGAYVGNHVVYYSRFMRPRSIIVLEPNPEAIGLLRRNLAANAVTIADLTRLGIAAAGGGKLRSRVRERQQSRRDPSRAGGRRRGEIRAAR